MKRFVLFCFCLCGVLKMQAQSEADIRRAIEAYDYETPIAQIAPASGDSLLTPLRAKALKAMNRQAEALKEWNSLLTDSTNVNVLNELAECYRSISRSAEAARCYQQLSALHPENKYFRLQHIRALLASENYESARSACHAWLERDTLSAAPYKYLGQAYEGMAFDDPNHLTNAFFSYNIAYRLDSLDGQLVASIAAIFNNNNQFADAVDVTERYRLSDTLNLDVNRQNAKAYCMQKDYRTAVKRYEGLMAMGDQIFTTLYYGGISYFGDNEVYKARDVLKKAYSKNPQDVNVLYYLAKSCSRSSYKKEGVEYMEEAMNLTVPKDSVMIRLYDGLAECYQLNQDYESQIKALRQLYKLDGEIIHLFDIAEAYESNKDYANAIYFYEKFMPLVPEKARVALDKEGKPIPNAFTFYQVAEQRIKYLKLEDFFRSGKPAEGKK